MALYPKYLRMMLLLLQCSCWPCRVADMLADRERPTRKRCEDTYHGAHRYALPYRAGRHAMGRVRRTGKRRVKCQMLLHNSAWPDPTLARGRGDVTCV